jgi:hypothetical protein
LSKKVTKTPMRAMVLENKQSLLQARDLPRPTAGPGQLLLQVKAAEYAARTFTSSTATSSTLPCP